MQQNKYNKGDQVQIANGDWFEYDRVKDEGFTCYVLNGEGIRLTCDVNLITNHRPAFDWGSVKAGDCFKCSKGLLWYYLSVLKCGLVCVEKKYPHPEPYLVSMFSKGELTRHPEGDIKEEV